MRVAIHGVAVPCFFGARLVLCVYPTIWSGTHISFMDLFERNYPRVTRHISIISRDLLPASTWHPLRDVCEPGYEVNQESTCPPRDTESLVRHIGHEDQRVVQALWFDPVCSPDDDTGEISAM